MFKKIKNIVKNIKSLSGESFSGGTWSLFVSKTNFSNFDRENTSAILQKLGGYQYYAGDVVAKTIAKQKLRLYAKIPTTRSKFTGKTEQIYIKNIPVSRQRLEYLKGNGEISHNDLMYKTLSAEKGIVEILDHPVLDLLRFQNPYSNCWTFLYTLSLSMQFYGNSYFRKVRNIDGSIESLWLVPAQYMEIIQGRTLENFIDFYKWGEAIGNEQRYDPIDILDFKIPGVGNSQVFGVSRIEIAWKYISLMDSSLTFKQALNKNMGRPDMIISSANLSKLNSDDLTRLERRWNDQFYGEAEAGKMAMTPSKIDVNVLPRTEIDYTGDEALVKAIATAFGVPEYMMLGSSNVKANSSQQEHDYKEYTIDSYMTMIEEILNENLLSEYDRSEDLFFAFDPILEEAQDIIQKRVVSLSNNGIITPNTAAIRLGEEPQDGGDVLRYRGRSFESLDSKNNNTEDNQDNNEDKNIIIPAKNIDNDEISDIVKKIDNLISKEDEEKDIVSSPAPVVINFGHDVNVIEEIVEDTQKGISKDNENIQDVSQEGIFEEKDNINKDNLSDKIANRLKENNGN